MDDTTLAFIDRILEPLRSQIGSVDAKLDRVLAIGERVAAAEQGHSALAARVTRVEKDAEDSKGELNRLKGRGQVIAWVLGGLGTALAGIAAAGAKALLGH